jgi:hypothetical protein
LVVLLRAEATRREEAAPPVDSVTVDGLIESVGGWLKVGENAMERVTVPEKPFRLKTDMVELSVSPFPMTISVLLLPTAKVGDGACV